MRAICTQLGMTFGPITSERAGMGSEEGFLISLIGGYGNFGA